VVKPESSKSRASDPEFTWSSRYSVTVARRWTRVDNHHNSAGAGWAPRLQTPEILSPCAFDRNIPTRARHRATWFLTHACDREPFESVAVGRTAWGRGLSHRQTFVRRFARSCTTRGPVVQSACRSRLEEGSARPIKDRRRLQQNSNPKEGDSPCSLTANPTQRTLSSPPHHGSNVE